MSSSSPSPSSSTVARWEFARRLRVRRQELELGIDVVAKHLGFSRNFFSAVENERSMLAADKLNPLYDLLEFDASDRDELTALNQAARNRNWWESRSVTDLVGEAGSRFLGLEQGASSIRTYDSLVIPGLLQLPDYLLTVMKSDPFVSQIELEGAIKLRQRRQNSLQDSGIPITALVSEAAFRQRWGNPDLHRRQLEHVVESAGPGENFELRILTFDDAPGVLAGSSTLAFLTFESEHLSDICYQEAIRDVGILEEGNPQFQRLRIVYEDVLSRARSHDESLEMIQEFL